MADDRPQETARRGGWYSDITVWVGLLLVVGGLALFLWKRGGGGSPDAAGNATPGSHEMLKVQWRARTQVDRPGIGGGQKVSSPVELDVGAVSTNPAVARQIAMLNPGAAGWETEVISERATAQLKKVAAALALPEGEQSEIFDRVLADGFACTPLVPATEEERYRGSGLTVARAAAKALAEATPQPMDAAHFAEALGGMVGTSGGVPRIQFKIVRVAREGESFTTRVLVETLGRSAGGSKQANATWSIGWSGDKMARLRVEAFERASLQSVGSSVFADVTASAFAGTTSFGGQFLRDNAHWAQRISTLEGMNYLGHHGIALGDINGDGLDDLYVPDVGGLPNRMYLQNPDGTLRDVSAESGTDWLEYTPSALLVDLDNDGDQDLVAATVQLVLFMENDGTGKFMLAGSRYGPAQARTMCAADYDLDGDLDLYICSYSLPDRARGFGAPGVVSSFPLPYNDANNGAPNLFFENRGELRFAEVTDEVGLDQNNTRYSFAAAWEDYDLDGDPDLYVANDFGRNNLYRNDGGRFVDVAPEAGVEDVASGMSAAWGDYDRDGRCDLYVSNMFSSAGGRITFQRQFAEDQAESAVADFQRMARGNTLFRSGGDGTFADLSEPAGVTMGRWAWGSQFADINNDGWLDLVVANGFVTGSRSDDL